MPRASLTDRGREPPGGLFPVLILGVLLVDLAFGGATHGEAISSAIARIASLPLLGLALMRLPRARLGATASAGIAVALLIVAIPIIQLAPLPPDIWRSLPGHGPFAVDRTAAGLSPAWMPISLAPYHTVDAALATLPPLAVFLGVLTLRAEERRTLALAIPIFAVAAVALGLMQSLGGPDSGLRFYAETNNNSAVGFFANRNHQAALLVCALAIAPMWIDGLRGVRGVPRGAGLFIAIAIEIVLVVGIGITRSRAGVLLAAPAMIGGSLAVVLVNSERSSRLGALALLLASAAGAALVALFARAALVARFETPISADLRVRAADAIHRAGESFFPWGSGLETFASVYRMFEPRSFVSPVYLNHAHNDWVEVWVEAGVLGVGVAAAFVLWWLWATSRVLMAGRTSRTGGAALAGSVVIALLLAHSTADYPLRTAALDCVFALACGLLARGGEEASSARGRGPAAATARQKHQKVIG